MKYENKLFTNNNSVVDFKWSDSMNFKRKLLIFLTSLFLILPFNTFAYAEYLIPGGENIGIKVQSNGVFVVGFYEVNGREIAYDAGLRIGDRIIRIDDSKVTSVLDLVNNINSDKANIQVKLTYIRNEKELSTILKLSKDKQGGYKTGIYVKDSITGIGTLTYINPINNTYGALGHEIIEAASGYNFTLLKGSVFSSKITSITKASIGNPGEKNAKLNYHDVYGDIEYNLETGIYGKLNKEIKSDSLLEVGNLDDVKIGKAEIITVLDNNQKEHFDIEILSIDKKHDTKNFLIKVVDERLINTTGGIIKGMSGSPIIQNNKIIGAVTHTIVDNPQKGYGISIVKMLESKE